MSEAIVEIKNLVREFGNKRALDNVSMTIQAGTVMGLVGENGAGKTTIIKHVLGLLKAQQGTVSVFGLDPVSNPESVLSKIGYLSEEGDLPTWMKVHELMRYSAAFYPTWDEEYAQSLLGEFKLDPSAKLSKMSKGQRSRAGLLVAMAYRPQLLVLDEPSSGLDPIVRKDILGAIIRTIADDGRTVLFSSHLLGEVERVADQISIVKDGKILISDSLDFVKESHFRATLVFEKLQSQAPVIPGSLTWVGSGREWNGIFIGDGKQLESIANGLGAKIVERAHLSLEEIFVAQVGSV
jgi:ABC-2 type transport system ATP-binding protein